MIELAAAAGRERTLPDLEFRREDVMSAAGVCCIVLRKIGPFWNGWQCPKGGPSRTLDLECGRYTHYHGFGKGKRRPSIVVRLLSVSVSSFTHEHMLVVWRPHGNHTKAHDKV